MASGWRGNSVTRVLALVALWLGLAGTAAAQVGAGQITGIVTDSDAAAVPGATVTAINEATGASRGTVSGSGGSYTVSTLAPGPYRVEIALQGFRTFRRESLRVETGETIRFDAVLEVGSVTESITVIGDVPLVRASASLGQVVTEEKVTALPLNGRSFITLAQLAPGVALPPGSQLPRINGGRPRTNEYLYDGLSVLQPEPGQVTYFPNVDAIQEFKVETNSPPAEFGRFNGGVVNLTTKSGTNTVRGTAFAFFRDESLNARNVFRAGTAKPDYNRTQFGGVVGGPIVRDRAFFFLDYQGQRQQIGRTVISTVPTVLQREGVFTESIGGRVPVIYDPATTASNGTGGFSRTRFAGNAIPADRFDSVAASLLQRYPLPTSAGTANNYRRTANETDDQDQWAARVDHRFGSRDQLFARLTGFSGTFLPVAPLPEGSGVTTGTLGPQDTTAWSLASNSQHTFSAHLLNEVRIGDTRRSVSRSAAKLASAAGGALNIPGIPAYAPFPDTLPTFQVLGYQQLGSPANTASEFSTSVTQVADTLTWVRGRHTIKAGLDWRWERLDVIQPPSPTGLFTFNAIGTDLPGTANSGSPFASFLLGQVQAFAIDLQQAEIEERAHFQEYFVQDDWTVSNRLTISPGLRYTLNFPSTEINGQTAVFNLRSALLEYPGDEPVRPLKKHNVGPRLGVVYRATDKTVVSAGYGLIWIEMAGITTPFTTPTFPFLQTTSERALDTISPAFVLHDGPSVAPVEPTPTAGLGQGVFSVDSTLGSGYAQQWNVSVQRELTSNTSIEVAYVGSKITHIGIPDTNINQLTAEQLALGPQLTKRVPNPYFGTIPRSSSLGDPTITVAQLMKPYPQYTTVSLYRNNVGNQNYNGVTARIEQRLTKGFSYLVSYTYSKLLDDASSVFDASILTGPVANSPVADSYNRRLERDYSTGDIPHIVVASATCDLPWGRGRAYQPGGVVGVLARDWSLATIVTLQSGMPVPITQTNLNAFAGFGSQRPNLVGDPELPADQRSAAKWFDPAAFALAPQFTLGTASRNPVRGPGYKNVDLSVSRLVRVGGRTAVELRAEIFNLLNTVNYGNPNGTFGGASFGTITTAFDPRVVQLAAKIRF